MSIGFFFLAISKGLLLLKHGLEPYKLIVDAVNLPGFISYYGVIAVIIELCLAAGVWERVTFAPVIIMASVLTGCGIAISLAFLVFKMNSDCGCGLLGDNEAGLLVQKIVILFLLAVLYKNKKVLFDDKAQV